MIEGRCDIRLGAKSHNGLLKRFIPALILLVIGEAVKYVDPFFADIENYSCLPGHLLYMTWYTMLQVLARRRTLHLLEVLDENRFQFLL
jgi:hypothetical protein